MFMFIDTDSGATISRQTYYAESLSESTLTTSTYTAKATLTFTPDANKTYAIFWSCNCICNSTAVSVFTRLRNTTDSVTYQEQRQENRTTTGAPYRTAHGFGIYTAGGSPGSTSFEIQYASSTSGNTSKIKNARVIAMRLESGDEWTVATATWTNATSNSYDTTSAVASFVFTPATSGDYLVFASLDYNHGSTSDLGYVRLLDPSSAGLREMQHINRDAADYNPYTAMVKQNLAASSQTYKIQSHRTSTNTITIKNLRFLALRLDAGFVATYYQETTGMTTTTVSASYTDFNSFTTSTANATHIVFSNAGGGNRSNGYASFWDYLDDGSAYQTLETRVDVTGAAAYPNYYPAFIAYTQTYSAASHTWKWDFKATATDTASMAEGSTAVLQIQGFQV